MNGPDLFWAIKVVAPVAPSILRRGVLSSVEDGRRDFNGDPALPLPPPPPPPPSLSDGSWKLVGREETGDGTNDAVEFDRTCGGLDDVGCICLTTLVVPEDPPEPFRLWYLCTALALLGDVARKDPVELALGLFL